MGVRSLLRPLVLFGLLLCAPWLATSPVRAQSEQQAPAHIAFVDGAGSLDREGQTEPAAAGVPFVPGDRLRTDRGRVEVLFPDGSVLDIDQFSSVDLLSPTLIRLTEGRVLLTVAGASNPSAAVRYQIDTPVASAVTDGPGEFRVALVGGQSGLETELAVLRGYASLATERGSINVAAGQRSLARDNDAPMYPQVFNSARLDAFDRWIESRRFDRTRTTASTQYLPNDLYMYGSTFDRHGAWRYESPYGNVWYPSVAFDWRPYYNGYWSSIRPYGWTWIGLDVWSWPTHHYGRWGHARNRWFWIPERRWASAWVSWGAAPGYVSWCPLGFDNRPVFGITVVGEPWAGWVVMPRTHFDGYRVNQWAIAPHRLNRNTPFVWQARAPVPPPRTYAVPRTTVGASASTGIAIPRDVVNSQQATAGIQQPSGNRQQAPGNRQRSPIGAQASPTEARPAPGSSILDRRRPAAVPRQPSADSQVQLPGDATAPPVDRSSPPTRQPRGDVWFRQPLPQAPALPQSRPLPQAPPAYRRNPGVSPQRAESPADRPERAREVTPRWGLPGGAAASAPVASQDAPRAVTPAPTAPRTAVPRGDGGYSRPSAPSAAPAPPPRSAQPEERSGPPSRSPGMAAPRSGPPPSAAPSAPARSEPPPSRSRDGGAGGGARQRRP